MEDSFLIERFPHIIEKIFEKLDNKSLTRCRGVCKKWQQFIDERKMPWIRIVNFPSILKDGNTYLHLAAKTGQTEMFETILNTESDKNPRNDYCTTPFHLICSNGSIKFAELLLKNLMPTSTTSDIYDLVMIIHDNNLNLKSKFSDTAFHLACRKGHSNIAEIIVNYSEPLNIDLNAKDSFGKNAFSLTCEFGHLKIAEMLMKNSVEKKIDLNNKDRAGWSAFQLACKYGYLNIAEIIIKNCSDLNIDLNVKNPKGETVFYTACSEGRTELVKLLIENSTKINIDFNATDFSGNTAFHKACYFGHKNIIELILDDSVASKIVQTKNNSGKTGFQLATEKALEKNKSGKTGLQLATEKALEMHGQSWK